jgi:hypothetical protein
MSSLRKIQRVIDRKNQKILLSRLAAEREQRHKEMREELARRRVEEEAKRIAKPHLSVGVMSGTQTNLILTAANSLGNLTEQ